MKKTLISLLVSASLLINSATYAFSDNREEDEYTFYDAAIAGLFVTVMAMGVGFLVMARGWDLDAANLDSYDRSTLPPGSSRGVFGTIYKADGSTDVWSTLTDTNPWYDFDD